MSKHRIDVSKLIVKPGSKARLASRPTSLSTRLNKADIQGLLDKTTQRLDQLQEVMYAEGRQRLLLVLQAMDAAGKDSTIRHVFGPVNPQGVRIVSFKAPVGEELTHDYLWRIHQQVPSRGRLVVFNRSHYEDVLIVRVKNLVPPEVWKRRYQQINDFERMLTEEGVTIVKAYLHISKAYQKKRLQRRLDNPDKHWKFNVEDLKERARWDAYRKAYEVALTRCSTPHAPWHVIPAEDRRLRDLAVATLLVKTLEGLKMKYPKPNFDPRKVKIV
ncbi:MAG: polyphosphate kinase 2 family protein [Phycisphaera sp.]|nr:polyphosphate kinase 2 family protein [Phycisphaera sp.]